MVSKRNTGGIGGSDSWTKLWNGVSSLLDFFAVLENLGMVNDKLYLSGILRKVWLCYSWISVVRCVWQLIKLCKVKFKIDERLNGQGSESIREKLVNFRKMYNEQIRQITANLLQDLSYLMVLIYPGTRLFKRLSNVMTLCRIII
ncbi:YCL056C [Saccharomyces arboricola H-6]|uniref:YCL056C n=1 Tax=Saccharomyces arboricola (strain H-6 / AS 2.3317 / CBS 10644) TaxID=1160507 RepID=J8QAG4_SACAR|nr:YCL056C [Saccharomyces arboricola H-6]